MPENLKLNTFLQEFHTPCPHPECSFGYYGFAFGQSPFPVPPLVQVALIENANKGAYAPVQEFLNYVMPSQNTTDIILEWM